MKFEDYLLVWPALSQSQYMKLFHSSNNKHDEYSCLFSCIRADHSPIDVLLIIILFQQISEAEFEKQGKEKTKQRRVTIATEHITNELSPHYATKVEKEAFRKIKEWKDEFAIRLDQVLKQRQVHNQDNDNAVKSQRHNCAQEDAPCKEYAVQSVSKPLKTQQDPKQQILIELRGFSESSVSGMGNSSDCETGSRILQEIKKQRRNSKRLDEKHLMENLSSWHRQETGRITSELCSYTSDVQHIRGLLYSLKETIDTIFTTTMQRVDDFISSSTVENDSTRLEHAQASCNEAVLLKNQIKRVEEERDRLLMENGSLNKQIAQLRSKLEQEHKGTVNLTSMKSDNYYFVEFVGLDNVKRYKQKRMF